MKKFWERLKQKWSIESDGRMAKIFVVFAITGSATVLVRKSLFRLLGIEFDSPVLGFIVKMLAIYFIYQLLLYLIGTIFQERAFFGWFIKKMNYRMIGRKPQQ